MSINFNPPYDALEVYFRTLCSMQKIHICLVINSKMRSVFYIEKLCVTAIHVEHLFLSPKVPLKMPAAVFLHTHSVK